MSETHASLDVADYGAALADGMEAALPGWVERQVAETMAAWAAFEKANFEESEPGGRDSQVASEARAAGRQAADDVGPQLRQLLARDIDDQPTTPLAIVRGAAVRYPTDVLKRAGVPPVRRDAAAEELFPDDLYDLAPAAFGDLAPDLTDIGLRWGAAKAFEHMRRHGGS